MNIDPQAKVWEDVWRNTVLTEESIRKKVRRETLTLRWQAIRKSFLSVFGTLKGVKTIELGAGTGDISLLLALEGADVTLLDANDRALDIARFQFKVCGLTPRCVTGDMFDLESRWRGSFDAAVSYGVVEHFEGPRRLLACKSHVDALRPGGMVAISVPNAMCLPYRIDKWWQEHSKKWIWGLEIPYTRKELFAVAEMLELQSPWIHGSSFLRDWDQFLFNRVTSRIFKYTGFHFERRTPFDPYWGHALTLIGGKKL